MSKKIKQIAPNTQIILVTAHNDVNILIDAIDIGVSHYILKPIDKKKFFDSVDKSLEVFRLEQENEEFKKELIIAKEKAEEISKLKDKFVSLVAHDLKSPFIDIVSFLPLLKQVSENHIPEKFTIVIDKMISKSKIYLNLIEDILNMNRIQTGKIKPDIISISIKELINQILISLESKILDKNIILKNQLSMNNIIKADLGLAREVFYNIIHNAIKFSNKECIVTISYDQNETFSIVKISDNGVGMEPYILENIFKPEKKTTTIGTAGEIGTGLGLPLCHDIMKSHGGKIEIASKKGLGSDFQIFFPK